MANFETSPEFNKVMRKLEPTDRAHADVFNALFQLLLNNDIYLEQRPRIIIGPEGTEVPPGTTLFVTDEVPIPHPDKFESAAFTNMEFGASQPDDSENWGETDENANAQESKAQASVSYGPLKGKLTVSDQPDPDTVFFAAINKNQ